MVSALFARVFTWAAGNRLTAGLAVALALIASGAGLYAKGRADHQAKVVAERAAATAKLDLREAKADARAEVARQKDAAAVAAQQEKLTHAIQAQPDSAPGAVRRALSCERLRQSGYDLSKVPACAGPAAAP